MVTNPLSDPDKNKNCSEYRGMNKLNNFQLCIITFAFLHNYIAFSGHDCTLYIIMVTFEHAMENPSAMEGHTAKILNLQEKL